MAVLTGLLAAAGAIGSAALANKGVSNAAKATNNATQQQIAAQQQAQQQASAALAPWQQSGLAANNQINALLGLGGGTDWGQYLQQNPDVMMGYATADQQRFTTPEAYAQWHYQTYGQNEGRTMPSPQSGVDAARAAFDQFRNSTGYDFRVKQGMNALNSGYAGAGSIKSGAAIKAANDYGQGMASQEFGNYLGYLAGQQGLGANAASAQAGVAQNTGNNLTNIYGAQGNNLANAALVKSQNAGNAFNQFFTIGSNLAGSGFGKTPITATSMAGHR